MAASRAVQPEDSISNVSGRSWNYVHRDDEDADLPPPDLELPKRHQEVTIENKIAPPPQETQESAQGADQPASSSDPQTPAPKAQPEIAPKAPPPGVPPPPPAYSSAAAAPATQAAQNLLAGVNLQYGSRKLRKQAERAARKGARDLRFGQLGGGLHNALSSALPPYLRQVGSGENERSVIVVDSRDQRISSPFQGWLLDEILINAQAGVNVLSDAKLLRSPSTGYHMSLFYMRTLEGKKFILVGSMTSYGSVPCGKWDSLTGDVMSHPAFQPFRWPIMRDDSSTWVDVKVKVEGGLLLHLELRGYRSDRDMTAQLNYVNDALVMGLEDVLFIPSCTITVFQGWRVCAISFEVGGQLYACSEGGVVVALDFPLCHFEVRLTAVSSADSFGHDADRLEFRFCSSQDRLDMSCSTIAVPSSWLVVSRCSGPTLVRNARWCREHYARVESPDQTMQMGQIAGIHAHWTSGVTAQSPEETGARIGAVDVSSHQENLHLTCESPLFKMEKKIVPKEAIALQYHDPATEKATMILPPTMGAPAVAIAQTKWQPIRDLVGTGASSTPSVDSMRVTPVSLTDPGQKPVLGTAQTNQPIYAPRRSLDHRRGECMSEAAVTPQAFVQQSRMVMSSFASPVTPRVDRPSTVTITPEEATPGVPQSFGPAAEDSELV